MVLRLLKHNFITPYFLITYRLVGKDKFIGGYASLNPPLYVMVYMITGNQLKYHKSQLQ
jgi:hypothetical protein